MDDIEKRYPEDSELLLVLSSPTDCTWIAPPVHRYGTNARLALVVDHPEDLQCLLIKVSPLGEILQIGEDGSFTPCGMFAPGIDGPHAYSNAARNDTDINVKYQTNPKYLVIYKLS